MGKKLDFSGLAKLFEKRTVFELTDTEYRQIVGKELPKDKTYIKSRSPIAVEANSKGYRIEVVEAPIIQRKLIFTIKESEENREN